MKITYHLSILLSVMLYLNCSSTINNMNNQNNNPAQVALLYIKSFEQGADFSPPSEGLIQNEKIAEEALSILKKHLAEGEIDIRENIVALIIDTSLQISLSKNGTEHIDDADVLNVLVYEGMFTNDRVKENILDALRKLTKKKDLLPYHERFIHLLQENISEEILLLIAKAQVSNAKNTVAEIATRNEWQNNESVEIAQAALGEDNITDEYIKKTQIAHDRQQIEKFIEYIGILSLIGTSDALTAISEYMRTPLIIDKVGAYQKSVRLNIMDALRYHFPNQAILYPNNVNDMEDYTTVEQFCIEKFGTYYNQPQPPFMTYFGYPTPIRN